MTTVGDLYLVYLLLPTNADMRFHCEYKLVKASENRRSLFGSIYRFSTKLSLLGTNSDSKGFMGRNGDDFRKEQSLEKIKIMNMKCIRDDALLFTYWGLRGGKIELEEYKVEDFWKNEIVAKMKIDKMRKVKLDLLKHAFDSDCSQKLNTLYSNTFSTHSFKILDVILYQK